MQAISDNSSGHILHFSAINSLVNYVIYPSINSFMQTHPAVHLSVESQHSYTAIGRVLSGILDGAFICNITVTRCTFSRYGKRRCVLSPGMRLQPPSI